ncbi:Arc family DNA-binding protein [Bordetella bronchialis]
MPPELKDWLTDRSQRNFRSVNAEVVSLIKAAHQKENAPLAGTGEAFDAQ